MKKIKFGILALLATAFAFGATACELPFGIGGDSSSSDAICEESVESSSEETSEEESSSEEQGPTEEELAAMGAILKQAYALESGAALEGTHTLTGTVTDVKDPGDGEACLTFVVEGYDQYPMYCYWLKGEYAGNLKVGDIITVTGTIKNYKGTVEYDKPNLDSYIAAPEEETSEDSASEEDSSSGEYVGPTEEELAAMGAILEQAYALESGTTMEGTHTLTGKVTNVKSTGEGEACLTFVVEGYDQYPMYCYWVKGEYAGNLKVGDIITVTGTIKNYNGTIEYDKPNLDSYQVGERAPLEVITTPGTGIAEGYDVISIAMAKEICAYVGEATTIERYYIHATIDSVSNAKYGEMYISDATGNSIKVYGTYSEDGSIGYANMTEKPFKGAEVLLSCTLHSFKESAEIANARLIAFENVTLDESVYTDMTLADARLAADGTQVKVDGVVARITYANGFIPNGVYIVDETDSIYVYDRDFASRVAIGNKVTILGDKTHWILDTEIASANKFGYKGGNQIENVWLVYNDEGNNEWDKTWVKSTTVKKIMDTPASEDITNTIFKVNALVKEVPGNGFTNYYIDDLDEVTGSYVYTQCNGNDFDWLKDYDNGKIHTVYLSVINAKSTSSGCVWRFVPIAVEDNGYVFDTATLGEFIVEYYALDQFKSVYTADPALVLTSSASSELLGFETTAITYTSANPEIISITQNDEGNYVMNCVGYGTTTITIAVGTYEKVIEITYEETTEIPSITVAEAIATAIDTEITVKGIVGPSVVNKDGFYLFGEDGSMISVLVATREAFDDLEIGNEIILKGMRERYVKSDASAFAGQTCIVNAEILQNNYGNHAYSTAKFIQSTAAEFYALDPNVDYSTNVYVFEATVEVVSTAYYTNINIVSGGTTVGLYCSGAAQYSWLQAFAGQTVTMEVAACNWNDKTYWRGCVLAVYTEDGKVLNTLNFN